MRELLIAAVAALALAGPVRAETVECKPLLDGGTRCKHPDGTVTERRPMEGGGEKTTSTNPTWWGRSNGAGGGWTPPDAMLKNDPALIGARGRVSEPWEPRPKPVGDTAGGKRIPHPDGSETRCEPEGGVTRCRTR